MCGIFLGSSCAFRMSENLNWTIHIPDPMKEEEGNIPEGLKESNVTGQELTGRRDRNDDDVIRTSSLFSSSLLSSPSNDVDDGDLVQDNLEAVDDEDAVRKRRKEEERRNVLFVRGRKEEESKKKKDEKRKKEKGEESGKERLESYYSSFRRGTKSGTFQVVQITDIHFDPYFSPGTRSDCGEPVCCRNVNGPASTLASMAGIWGDYTDCDTPYFTIDAALKQVSNAHPDVCSKPFLLHSISNYLPLSKRSFLLRSIQV